MLFDLSQKSRYAVAAVLALAQQDQSAPVQIKTICGAKNIPQPYLEQLMTDLKRAGVVQSYRGSQGGYKLAKSPSDISILEILVAIEGDLVWSAGQTGVWDYFWKTAEEGVKKSLSVSIQSLLEANEKIENRVTYAI